MARPAPITRDFRRLAGIALVLIAPTSMAWGQSEPASPRPSRLSERRGVAPAKEATPAPSTDVKAPAKAEAKPEPEGPGFFGDTKKFSRIGGWGSFGNAMGQFGFAKSSLILMPPVQEELKLTDDQKKQLREWQDSMRKRGEEMGKAMREKGGDPFRGQENASIATRINQFTGMINQFGGLIRENEQGLSRILKSPQRKRLDQISLQMEGISALTRPDIAESVGLLPEQMEEIQQILNLSRMSQMTTWVGSMMTMRNQQRRPDPNAKPGQDPADPKAKAKAESKDEAPDKAQDPADPKVRAEREKAMRQRFETMRDQTDRIQNQAVTQIARTLNKAQRTKFENLLGPPFDPKKINNLGRPPGRGGPAEKPKADEPAVTK